MGLGLVLLGLVALLWISDERRLAAFVLLGLFVPYLAVLAPFKCGGYTRRGHACRRIGTGLLIGCSYHRFDRLGRIFGHDRDRAAAQHRQADRSVAATASVGLAGGRSAGAPTRPRAFDIASFAVAVSSMIAGWLALLM